MDTLRALGYAGLGLLAGTLSGLLGIGGAVVIIPALVLLFGFSQRSAQGTTLFLMIPPIGLLAVLQYWKSGSVDWRAGLVIALFFFLGGLLGGKLAVGIDPVILRKLFAVFLFAISLKTWFG